MGGAFSSSSSGGGGGGAKAKGSGTGGGGTISSIDRAVLDLKNARDRLSKYQKKLELDEFKLIQRAKQAKETGQTTTALNLLRLRKYKQQEVTNCQQQLLTVLQLVGTIDSKQNEQQVLQALQTGKNSLQKLHEETSIDDVLELMDQIQEQNELEIEISNAISQGTTGALSLQDEADVEAELEQLMKQEQEQVTGETTSTTTTTNLPIAPNNELLPVAPTSKLPEATTTTTTTSTSTTVSDNKRVALPS